MNYPCQFATVVLIAKRNHNENNRHETLTTSGEELSQLVADVGLLLQVAAALRLALCFLELCGPITSRTGTETGTETTYTTEPTPDNLKNGVPVSILTFDFPRRAHDSSVLASG